MLSLKMVLLLGSITLHRLPLSPHSLTARQAISFKHKIFFFFEGLSNFFAIFSIKYLQLQQLLPVLQINGFRVGLKLVKASLADADVAFLLPFLF